MKPEIKIERDLVSLKVNRVELGRISEELARMCKVDIKVSDNLKNELVSIEIIKMPLEKLIMRLINSLSNRNYVIEYGKIGENYGIKRIFIGVGVAKDVRSSISHPSPLMEGFPSLTPPLPMINESVKKYFVGDEETKKYYNLNSMKAMRLKEENKVWFKSVEEAEKVGYLFEDTTWEEEKFRQESMEAIGTPIPMRPDSLERHFVGDRETYKCYRLDNPNALQLKTENKIWFKGREEAEHSGFIFVENER